MKKIIVQYEVNYIKPVAARVHVADDRRRKISYQEALQEVPQLRSISRLYYLPEYQAPQEKAELDELQAILRYNSPDSFLELRRFRYLCGKFKVKGLPLEDADHRQRKISNNDCKDNKFKCAGCNKFIDCKIKITSVKLTSQIYSSPYKRV